MHIILDLFTNKIFLAPAVAWVVAQIINTIIDFKKAGFNKERMVCGSGMPSSYGAVFAALIIITGLMLGTGSFEFAIVLIVAIVVINDARGVRYETQRQGRALNNLNEERQEEGKQPLDIKKFREKLGDYTKDIVVGVILGIASAILVYYLPI